MDKGKNRKDLLKAGREKLQQFRKNNKGGSSKSSKAGKSRAAAEDTVSLSESNTRVDPVGKNADASTDATSVGAITSAEIASPEVSVQFPSEDSGMDETRLNPDDGQKIDCGVQERDGLLLVLEDEIHNTPDTSDPINSIDQSDKSIPPLPIDTSPQTEMQHVEEQEAGSSSLNQIGEGGGAEIEGPGALSNELNQTAEDHITNNSSNTDSEESADASAHIGKSHSASSIDVAINDAEEAQVGHNLLNELETGHAIKIESTYQQNEDIPVLPVLSNEEKVDALCISEDNGDGSVEVTPARSGVSGEDRSLELHTDETKTPFGCRQVDLSSVLDGSLIKLSQLAEILDGDQMEFLLQSRKLSGKKIQDTDEMKDIRSLSHEAIDWLKEQLYVATISKDAFCLELSEHQNLIDKILKTNASLDEVQKNNKILTEEIVQCRYEIQEVVSLREELEKQLQVSNDEIRSFSTEINELQHELETTQSEMSTLVSELVDCRNLVETLQAEKKSLNGSFHLVTEEKDKLFEENEMVLLENVKIKGELAQLKASIEELQMQQVVLTESLTLARDDTKQLEKEKEHFVHENSKFIADMAEYKSNLEALREENRNLNESLTSLSEERDLLGEEKESVVHQAEKFSNELMDCKHLVSTLEMEISNLNESLNSITEERKKVEKEREKMFLEYEKQSQELAEIKVSEADIRAECSKVVKDLKEATFQVNQLSDENETLKTNSEFYKSNIKIVDQENLSARDVANNSDESEVQTQMKPEPHSSSLVPLQLDVYNDSVGFLALKRHLEEAGTIMLNLDKAIESMHSYSNSLNRSNDKTVGSGVSKLIQAFESKVVTDDPETEESPISENQTSGDPYVMTKLVTKDLEALLMDIVRDAENASEFCKEILQSKLFADAAGTEVRSSYDALREHADQVEGSNIELMVLYEAMKQNFNHAVAKEDELRILCDSVQKQEHILKSENTQLSEKLKDFEVKVTVLQSQLNGICKSSEDTVASLSDELKILQEEVSNRQSSLEEEWDSIVTQILQIAGELDAAVDSSNSLTGTSDNHDVVTCVKSSVVRATKVIEDLQRQLEAAQIDCKAASGAYNDMIEKSSNLQAKNEVVSNTLNMLHNNLNQLVIEKLNCSDETENVLVDHISEDLLHPDGFKPLLDQLKNFLDERMQIKSTNEQLNTELMNSTKHIDELERQCLEVDAVAKLVDDIEQSLRKDGVEIDACEPAHRIESVINLLFEKYKVAGQSLSLSTSLEMQVTDLQGQVEHLNATFVECESENIILKQSLKSAEEYAVSLNSILQEKVAELEQSEQRVASIREKLSIAVTKGKGLISQRDNLKQSLAEISKELEKSSQELLLKDASLHELESKLEVYAEAGERMEALESELSYIRNSATALRESFLLKDSALQRIEEILEDLELPENLYSGDIIEKIDWLAKSVSRTSLPHNEWDHRSSAEMGSHSDGGTLGVSEVIEEMKPNPNSTEDLSMRYEELQSKFYELAEQNEMLEQSLMERNNHIQHWEEILERIDIPSPLRSLEPEDKIQWLESALAEAQNQCSSLQKKIENLENTCGSQTASLEDSQRRISEIDTAFQQAILEKETLSRDLEIMRHDNDEISRKAADVIVSNEKLQNEVNRSQEHVLRIEEDIRHTEAAVRRLQELVMNALQYSITEDVVSDNNGINHLEVMLRSLVEKYEALSSVKLLDIDPVNVPISETGNLSYISRDGEEQEIETLRKKLEDCTGELMALKEEKDSFMLKNQSLSCEIEALDARKNELQELLNQEEQKSASVREKLNMAVRKGKSLVQQRDGMKQVIEELNAEVGHLKSETKLTEKAMSEYEERIQELSTFKDRATALESETMLLRDRLAKNEWTLQEKEVIWSSMLDALGDIDVDVALYPGDPVEKVKELGKYLGVLRVKLNSAEQETRKSKRAAELLLAELNEVQERNDGLQEELIKASHLLSEVSREKDLAETAKAEALAHVETLYIHSEEKDRQLSELMVLKSGVDQMREELLHTETELGDVLSKDVEVLHSLEAMMMSFLEPRGNPELTPFPHGFTGIVKSMNSENKAFLVEIGSFREQLHNHSRLVYEEASRVAEVVFNVHREYVSQKEKHESVMRDIKRLELTEKEKESELQHLRGSISLLYDTCTSIISEIGNRKNQVLGNALFSKFPERYSRSQLSVEEGNSFTKDMHVVSEEQIKGMREKLILLVNDFMSMQSELMEDGQREMKSTLVNLQKELQEKDVQRDRICTELINQIKEAETNANNYRHEVQQVRTALSDLQSQVTVMEEEREVLEQRMRELKDQETDATDLRLEINSLTDALAAKEQENEALMQALDEEETQMEDLKNKIGMLETELLQKKQEIEKVEASRSKALKKHSVAVSKFDEVHNFSNNLVSEVEMLQSQLQERDGEISFLRQEVTRCTNDVLAATQMSKKKSSDEILNVLMWFDSLLSRVKDQAVTSDYKEDQVNECKEILQRQIVSLVSELENLRSVAQNSDMLLQQERSKVEEFEQKEQLLKNSLRAKESQILALQGSSDFVIPANSTSEIVEVEQMKNNWAPPGTTTQQVRSLRKANNDQVAIAIDDDKSSDMLEDDDDKAHGFKSLTTSKIVPRFTRPISDMVDGLWVSCDRALMRQPALRLGVIIYWAILHTLLAAFVV